MEENPTNKYFYGYDIYRLTVLCMRRACLFTPVGLIGMAVLLRQGNVSCVPVRDYWQGSLLN
ncbi:MAG: hypothetical protein U9Q98_10230 [Bacteroidota bacterium]|nr:hypothetical protein [Bacteroidota bacterium]